MPGNWGKRWRELRGVGRKSTGDPMLDLAIEQMDKLTTRMQARRDAD
jgi:hypothetical protein